MPCVNRIRTPGVEEEGEEGEGKEESLELDVLLPRVRADVSAEVRF